MKSKIAFPSEALSEYLDNTNDQILRNEKEFIRQANKIESTALVNTYSTHMKPGVDLEALKIKCSTSINMLKLMDNSHEKTYGFLGSDLSRITSATSTLLAIIALLVGGFIETSPGAYVCFGGALLILCINTMVYLLSRYDLNQYNIESERLHEAIACFLILDEAIELRMLEKRRKDV